MSGSGIKTSRQLRPIVKALQRSGKKVVFTNGCFDLLHTGHVRLFEFCRQKGDCLIVAVNSDRSVRAIKGSNRPIQPARDRAHLCAALHAVDYVVLFHERTPEKLIRFLRPDVLVKGGDWSNDQIVGREFVPQVIRFPVVKNRSTSALIERIVKRFHGTH
ncbi:MAG: adenylyltransferase/cytidyltransferase family protein [Elusimicrobia bacterium]|nr:adenylyltransferase/cytidyltransferase family protein [Elusimicrobiota bacterium]MBD3411816.1 adenylyltransferase/cytidyltransferase family protein [Elusimicrobiota bacterium]